MKKLCIALFLSILGPYSWAGDISINQFSGLDTLDNPATLPQGASQDLLNVNLGIGGVDVHKREGYGLFQVLNTTYTSKGVRGGYHFQQVGGNDVQIWASSSTLYSSVNDAAFVAIATGTVDATWQCTDSQGYAYCFSSARDTPVKTDGTTGGTTYQGSTPLGTMAAFTPLQLVVAGVSGNENTVYVSSQNAFNGFNIGVLPGSPFIEPIASPGSRITHLAYYFGKLFWWKDQSFGYATFTNQFDWQLNIVSNQIGTLDNSDAFWNSSGFDSGTKFSGTAQAAAEQSPGGIFFRGQDNHIYVYDGYYLTRISRPITPTITSSSRKKASAWVQTSASDFNSGSGYATYTDTTTNSGDIILSGISDNFTSTAAWSSSSGTWTITGDTIVAPSGSFGTGIVSYLYSSTNSMSSAFYASARMRIDPGSFSTPYGCFGVVNNATNGYWACIFNTVPGGVYWLAITTSPTNAINRLFVDASTSPLTAVTTAFHTITLSRTGAGILTASFDGTVSTNTVSNLYGNLQQVVLYSSSTYDALPSRWDNIYVKSSTGIYYSSVDNAPNLTTWSNFSSANSISGNSSISYFVRSSTNSFTVLSSTPTWISQTNGSIVSASTGTYFQMKASFTVTAATESPTINDFSFNWFEGSASDKAYMTYFNDAIWFAVSSGSSTSTNNRIFYWDILNAAWLVYDIPVSGFQVENNALYFASPTGPYVYKFGGVSTDNGAAINSYWRSRSVLGTDPFVQNEFVQADFILGESSTTLTYTYTLDSSTSTVFSMTAYDSKASLIQRNFLLPVGKIGKYYDFTIGDNSSAQAWRMMGHKIHYNALNWRPVTQ